MLQKYIPKMGRSQLSKVEEGALPIGNNAHIVLYQSITEIGEEWDIAAPIDNQFLQRPYLTALELHPPIGMHFCYLVFYKNQEPIGIAIGQIQHFNADRSLNKEAESKESDNKTPCFFTTLARYFKGLVASKVDFYTLVIGNLLLTGEHGFYFKSSISEKESIQLLEAAMIPAQDELDRRGIHISAALVKEIYEEEKGKAQELLDRSFSEFTVQPNMVMDLRPTWKTIEDYKADLTSKYRVRFKRALKKGATIEKKSLSAEEIEANLPRIFELYKAIANNSGFNLINLNENYLLALKKTFPTEFNLYAYYLDGKMIAYYTTILNGHEMEAHFLGYDHAYNHEHQVYLNILYDLVANGIEHQVERIVFARTAMIIKSSVGAVPIEMYCYFRHRSSFSNKFLHPLLDYLKPKDEWEQRHPFK